VTLPTVSIIIFITKNVMIKSYNFNNDLIFCFNIETLLYPLLVDVEFDAKESDFVVVDFQWTQ